MQINMNLLIFICLGAMCRVGKSKLGMKIMNGEMTLAASWLWWEIRWFIRSHIGKHGKKYAGRIIMSVEDANQYIYDCIKNAEPFFAGRLGNTEMRMIAYSFRNRLFPFRTDGRKDVLHDLYFGAGFFPKDMDKAEQFVELMEASAHSADLLGEWNLYMEEWFVKQFMPGAKITKISFLQPWNIASFGENALPWTAALAGKKVLVIHPFSESIEKQYRENRERIFANLQIRNVLPEFELITLKAVQSMGDCEPEYEDWFAALDDMTKRCMQIEFDVAIIGCGAYGFPLASRIKNMGKAAIHLGGVTQLLFGIRGRRWDNYDGVIGRMMNEYWVRPSEKEQIKEAGQVENACYW